MDRNNLVKTFLSLAISSHLNMQVTQHKRGSQDATDKIGFWAHLETQPQILFCFRKQPFLEKGVAISTVCHTFGIEVVCLNSELQGRLGALQSLIKPAIICKNKAGYIALANDNGVHIPHIL